jgi:hypothetical protein
MDRGYASCISFPLIIAGKAFGAFATYASEPDAFDEEDVIIRFLASLAEKVSLGVSSIRTVTSKREAERAMRSYMTRLERTNSELEEFAFIAWHDLQEPSRKIQTSGIILKEGCSGCINADRIDYVTKIENCVNRMRSLSCSLTNGCSR